MAHASRSELLTAFGRAIRALRQLRGVSQEELAEQAGIHRTYVGDIERGLRNVSLINLDRLAVALEVSLSGLMAEVDRRREATPVKPRD